MARPSGPIDAHRRRVLFGDELQIHPLGPGHDFGRARVNRDLIVTMSRHAADHAWMRSLLREVAGQTVVHDSDRRKPTS